ncbi:PIR protein [Plasmodium vivax]|uniref:VIR protein n=1 Tax=Plasmodium vivax TaxID=5855 RepID=A0A565A5D3_PLAVI|nr:PIR protein [Plasmodium vivax]
MPEILDDSKLNDLQTKNFYHQLDNANDDCKYDTFYSTAKVILNHYNVREDDSNKILKGLCYVYGNNFRKETDDDICNFLYYWLGGILYDNFIHRINLNNIISKVFIHLRNHRVKKCTAPTYFNIKEVGYFKDIKLFFDYSKDYDTYKKQITKNNLPCHENYNEYLQKYVAKYKEFEGKCKSDRTSGYCKAFNEYFDKKDPSNLSNWTCNLQQNKTEEEQAHGETKEMQKQQLQASERGKNSVTLTGGFEEGRGQGDKGLGSSVYPSSKETTEMGSNSPPSYDPPTPTITKSIVTAASAAGLLVPPFLIYNFTPVRSWINKLLGRNQIYRNPLTERELIENSYQPHHFDSERNRYNISYRPE